MMFSMSITGTPSRQQERVEATRQNILDAAVRLYAEQGVDATTISSIIEHSGIGRTTFYRYFDDQDAVLNAALLRDFEDLITEFEGNRYEHPDIEAQIVDDMIWFHRQLLTRPALRLIYSQADSKRFYSRIRTMLERAREAGTTCASPTFERAAKEGRLRDGVTLENYVAWATFIITSLQTVPRAQAEDDFQLRDMLRLFLVPSLIRDQP